jgi:hypothetical protein
MTWLLDPRAWRTPVRAEAPGSAESAATVLDLPELVPVSGRDEAGEPDADVRGWLTTDPVADREATWRRWARAFDRTGLWPLLVSQFDGRPFRAGELGPVMPAEDAGTVLASGWAGLTPVLPDGTLLPHPPWPGLAPGRGAPDPHGVVLPHEFAPPVPGSLLLVPARRPADTLAHLGWYGACNWSLTGAAVSGVLQSWEERFGAYVVSIGFATLDLVVTRPPTSPRACGLVADEHLAFCPDNFSPQTWPPELPITRAEYAARLRTATLWHFWWD